MKNYFFLTALLLVGLSACDSTSQYGVYVKNATDKNIKIVYKSVIDVNNKEEQTKELKPGEQERIIWTENIEPEGSSGTSKDHCTYVAEYINAFMDDTPSTLKWCAEKIQFSTTDIGQAEFTIEYTNQDF